MATFSNESRQFVNRALAANYSALVYAYDDLPEATLETIDEMIKVTDVPYDPENVNIIGDTLDRHSHSCIGNLQEVITLMTLLKYDNVNPESVQILRSYEDQVTTKADLAATLDRHRQCTYQVKTATYGTGGQLFVSEHELDGTADFTVYVGAEEGIVYRFYRADFRRNMKTEKDINGPYDRWWGKSGWFVTPSECWFIEQLPIPNGVSSVYLMNNNVPVLRTYYDK